MKWADYLVSGVCYEESKPIIKQLEIRINDFGRVSEDKYYFSRMKVIALLRHKVIFYTINKSGDNYEKGHMLNLIKINGREYIRTDNNTEENDFITDLPEFMHQPGPNK